MSPRSPGIRGAVQRGEFWRSTVLFPAPGRWELRATAGAQALDATVYVYPASCAHGIGTATPSECAPP